MNACDEHVYEYGLKQKKCLGTASLSGLAVSSFPFYCR